MMGSGFSLKTSKNPYSIGGEVIEREQEKGHEGIK